MDFERSECDALLERELARFGRAVSRIKDSALLVDSDCVADFFSIESGNDSAIAALAGWRSVLVHLVHLISEKVQVAHPVEI